MKKTAGTVCAFASAFIFGFTPILGKLSYAGGSNGVTLTFLRALFAIPVLLVLLRVQRVPLAVSRRQARDLVLVGLFGPAATTLLLYASYQYVSVGIATVLHFVYPVTVTVASILLFRYRVTPPKLVALGLCAGGVVLFFENTGAVGLAGVLLALASSITYTVYMLGVGHTPLSGMHYFKLSLYFCAISLVVSGLFGVITGTLTFRLTGAAWLYSFLVSMFVSVGAITLFQLGITLIGAPTTAILSTLEPITSVVLGVLILSERLSAAKLIGCALIFAGVVIVTLAQLREVPHSSAPDNAAETLDANPPTG